MPRSISIFDELLGYIQSGNKHKIGHFKRKMRDLPTDQQEDIWRKLRDRGFARFDISPVEQPPTATEKLTEEEWNTIAQVSWDIRKNDPTARLIDIANTAMDSLKQERRFKFHSSMQLKTLIQKLTQIDERYRKAFNEHSELLNKSKGFKTKEEIIAELNNFDLTGLKSKVIPLCSIGELLDYFSQEEFLDQVTSADLLKAFHEKTFAQIEDLVSDIVGNELNSIREILAKRQVSPTLPVMDKIKLPKVTILGLLPAQQNLIKSKIGKDFELRFIDKNMNADTISTGQDLIVVALSFVSHAIFEQARKKAPENGFIGHTGGHSLMVDKILEWKKKFWKG